MAVQASQTSGWIRVEPLENVGIRSNGTFKNVGIVGNRTLAMGSKDVGEGSLSEGAPVVRLLRVL